MKVYMKVMRPVMLSDVDKRTGGGAGVEGVEVLFGSKRTSKNICGRMLRMELPGRRLKRRPKVGYMDEVSSRKRRGCRGCALAYHRWLNTYIPYNLTSQRQKS